MCIAAFLLLPCALAWGQKVAGAPPPPPDVLETQQEIALIESLLPKLADRAAAEFQLAHDYAHLGNSKTSISLLNESLATDEGFDPEDDADFHLLRNEPDFRKLIERVHLRYSPVHRATTAFTIAEKDLIPEGLAADHKGNLLYMGSLNRRKIVKIAYDGTVSDLFPAGKYSIQPICGIKVEEISRSVWAATCSDEGKGAELLHFDSNGNLLERFSPPGLGKHLLNDLVLHGSTEIYVTDSLANHAYRFNRKSHAFTEFPLCRPVYYPNGIALKDDGNVLYIADAFGILQVNLNTGSSSELNPGPENTVSGADGLYWYREGLIAVQNGLGKPRIARFRLSPNGLKVIGTTILEYRTPNLKLPTTGAIIGSKFYFISNSQIANFRDGRVLEPAKLEPIRILALDLTN